MRPEWTMNMIRMSDKKSVRDLMAKSLRKSPLVKVKMGQETGKNSEAFLLACSDTGEVTLGLCYER
jgi:hypothetical protein